MMVNSYCGIIPHISVITNFSIMGRLTNITIMKERMKSETSNIAQ
jgi:hypothetical protein